MNKIILTSDSGIDPTNEQNMIPALIIENGEKTYKDLNNLSLTTDKIITKFKQIEIVEINDEDEKIDAYE